MTSPTSPSDCLDGRVALVTGAGSPIGLGNVMCRALVARGARVAMVDVNEDWLVEGLREVESVGGPGCALPIVADVSDAASVRRAVDRTLADLGGLHVLVNNAGTTPRASGFTDRSCCAWEVPLAAWDRVVSVNLNGAFYLLHTAVPYMLAQGFGRIVGVTTSLDTMFRPRATPYGPSKAGHEALVAAVAREVDGSGVTANVLVPGGRTDTRFFSGMPDRDRSGFISPDAMGPPIAWLASDDSASANGMRIVASRWDASLPVAERLARATAPAAWPATRADAGA